ncbi:MAG TPA: ATP-dependent Clp protease proteolytic subunit [Bacteroidales bacterium]|nr:ATP-dependent Clp protease proteolytic subunit [Bacteroidales bacterium]HSA42512.1 ATP-dependent Clp protease proteolytic subunit [Bacteroidales bacterium]
MKESFIRFFAPVLPNTADLFFRAIDNKVKEKVEKLNILISSPGGSVFHGLSLYNYLKGLPIEINTFNFGSVDSIGVIIFCAGKKRCTVPHSRFLIHGVKFNINGPSSMDEKQIDEHLKSIRIDQLNIARVIADTTGKAMHKIEEDMHNRTTLNPQEAKDYGFVHEIKSDLLPLDADLTVISEPMQHSKIQIPQIIQQVQAVSEPLIESYTEVLRGDTI